MSSGVPISWRPMLRESGIAARTFFSGLSALKRANFSDQGLYDQAFFGITIGLERMMKLAILIHCKTPSGAGSYPTEKEFRQNYGHDLTRLFEVINEYRAEYEEELQWELPNRQISMTALGILRDFAKVTRYYNLDTLVGSPRIAALRDPVEAWSADLGGWIVENYYTPQAKEADRRVARLGERFMGVFTDVLHMAEDGSPVTTVSDSSLRSSQAALIQQEGVVICACLGRHVIEIIWELERAAIANGAGDVPYVHEFFGYLYNRESFFRETDLFDA